jgi:hypothetical protein
MGLVFESSTTNLSLGIVPTVPLAQDHSFCILLNDHLTAVTTSETYDALINSYVAIVKGDHLWHTSISPDDMLAEQQNICKLLHDNPPDVVIVEQDASKGYGFHLRRRGLWLFICITKYYVNKWMAAERVPKLALEAVLKAMEEHETAHWLFTLVCHIRMPLESLTNP